MLDMILDRYYSVHVCLVFYYRIHKNIELLDMSLYSFCCMLNFKT